MTRLIIPAPEFDLSKPPPLIHGEPWHCIACAVPGGRMSGTGGYRRAAAGRVVSRDTALPTSHPPGIAISVG